jgi:uncharacterized membrane protein YccC
MGPVLGVWLAPVAAHDLAVVALVGVLGLTVIGVVVYVLVARCLRDTLPADRAEILRALAELLGSLRRGEPTAHPWTARPGQSARRRRR